jgi:hypothetical protein
MDSELALLLHLQKLALSSPADQSALATVAPEALIADALAGLLAERELQQLQDMLARISTGTVSAAEAWSLANDLARAIKAKSTHADQIAARSALNRMLEDMFMLRFIAGSQLVGHIDLRIKSVKLFDYIPRLAIDPAPGTPATVIIGALSQTISQPDITVSSKNDSYIERRTEIVYGGRSPYPRLNLNTRSRRGALDVKNERFDWIQRPFPEYDLEICTFQERRVGSIQTRPCELPYTVEGQKLSITIPKQADTSILETTILDEKRNPLICCVRFIIAQEAITHQA